MKYQFDPKKFAVQLTKSGLTNLEFAEKTGVHRTKVSQYKKGQKECKNPKLDRMKQFAKVLGCRLEDITVVNKPETEESVPAVMTPLEALENISIVIEYTAHGVRSLQVDNELRWTSSDNVLVNAASTAKASFQLPRALAEYVVAAMSAGLDITGQDQLAAQAIVASAEAMQAKRHRKKRPLDEEVS